MRVSIHKLLFSLILCMLLFCPAASFANATATGAGEVCHGSDDALKIMQTAVETYLAAGSAEKASAVSSIYKENKWMITCALVNGIQNLDAAANYIRTGKAKDAAGDEVEVMTILGAAMLDKTATGNQISTKEGGVVKENTTTAENIAKVMADSMESLSKSPAFKTSVVDRTRYIGIILLGLTFLIAIAAKLYSMLIGTAETEPIDFAFMFMRLVTLITLLIFMKPLAFYGMQISTYISNILLNQPISVVISSSVLYGGNSGSGGGSVPIGGGISAGERKLQEPAACMWLSDRDYRLTSNWGMRNHPVWGKRINHDGVDLAAPKGTLLKSPYNGTATCQYNRGGYKAGYGAYITFVPDGKSETHILGHLLDFNRDLCKKVPSTYKIKAGDILGKTGNSGVGTGNHLHWGVHVGGFPGGTSINPWSIQDRDGSGASSTPSTPASTAASGDTVTPTSIVNTNPGFEVTDNDAFTLDMLFNELISLRAAGSATADSIGGLYDMLTSGWSVLGQALTVTIAGWFAKGALAILLVVADVMMGITMALGPIVVALTFVPTFENYLQNWIKGYLTFLFYQPLAACFTILMFVMLAVTCDSGFGAFLLLCICYVGACLKIPNVADGLSTTALAGVAMTMAYMPAKFAANAAAKAGGAAVGFGLAGPAGALMGAQAGGAVADKAADIGGEVVGGVANTNSGSGSSNKHKKSNKSGHISARLLAIIAIVLLMLACFASCASATTARYTAEQKKELLDIRTHKIYPDPELVILIRTSISSGKLDTGTMSSMSGGAIVDNVKIQPKNEDDQQILTGIYNTSYQNTADLPITRFILGNADVDAGEIYVLALEAALRQPWDKISDTELKNQARLLGLVSNVESATSTSIKEMLYRKGQSITIYLDAAQKVITEKLMFQIPFALLFLMFMIQIATISYLKIVEPNIGQRASYVAMFPRIILWMIFLLFFKEAAAILITFSNYLSNAIVPIEDQSSFMAHITMKAGANMPGEGFDSLMVSFFRLLTYMAVKILLIARDMFFTVTCIIGPLCIALGYYTRYRDPDPIHQFFTGWLQGFIKLLFWGPLAAIMLYSLGVLSVLTSLDMLSVLSVAITALAFLYAAGNIPNLAEKMSAMAVAGLLTAMGGYMIGASAMGVKGGFFAGKGFMNFMFFNGAAGMAGSAAGAGGGLFGGIRSMIGAMKHPMSGFANAFGQKQVRSTNTGFKAGDIDSSGSKAAGGAINTAELDKANILAGADGASVSALNKAIKSGNVKDISDAVSNLPRKYFNSSDLAKMASSLIPMGGKGANQKDMNSAVAKASSAINTKALVDASKHGLTAELLLHGRDGKSGLIDDAAFLKAAGLEGESKALATALVGMIGVRTAMSSLMKQQGKIPQKDYNRAMFDLTQSRNELEDFIQKYSRGELVEASESLLQQYVANSAADGLYEYDSLMRNDSNGNRLSQNHFVKAMHSKFSNDFKADSINTAIRNADVSEIENIAAEISEGDPERAAATSGKQTVLFKQGTQSLDNVLGTIHTKMAKDRPKEIYSAMNTEESFQEVFIGGSGLAADSDFLGNTGLAGEAPSVSTALISMVGLKQIRNGLEVQKDNMSSGAYQRAVTDVDRGYEELSSFVNNYADGAYDKMPDEVLRDYVSDVTTRADASYRVAFAGPAAVGSGAVMEHAGDTGMVTRESLHNEAVYETIKTDYENGSLTYNDIEKISTNTEMQQKYNIDPQREPEKIVIWKSNAYEAVRNNGAIWDRIHAQQQAESMYSQINTQNEIIQDDRSGDVYDRPDDERDDNSYYETDAREDFRNDQRRREFDTGSFAGQTFDMFKSAIIGQDTLGTQSAEELHAADIRANGKDNLKINL